MSVALAWTTSEYQHILSAAWDDGALAVHFEDGARVRVEAERLLPSGSGRPDWPRLTAGTFELIVPTSDRDVVISWVSIRAASDPAYAAHLARSTAEQAVKVGHRLASMREAQELTIEIVAERSGLDRETLAGVEDGRQIVSLSILRRLTKTLGGSLQDLADPA